MTSVTGPDVAVIVVAAGSSTRFGGDKLGVLVAGRPVLERAVGAMRAALPAAPLALVVRADQLEAARARWQARGVLVAAGGARRQDSVRNGFVALDPGDDTVVVVHDGARPFVPAGDVTRVVAAAAAGGAALLVAPVVDTVKRLRADGTVEATVPRDKLARALTPQAFRAAALRAAWAAAGDAHWTDEAALVERQGGPVAAVPGDPRNVKVTHPDDLDARCRRLRPADAGRTGRRRPPVRARDARSGSAAWNWRASPVSPGTPTPTSRCTRSPTPSSAPAAQATSASTFRRPRSAGATRPPSCSCGAPWRSRASAAGACPPAT